MPQGKQFDANAARIAGYSDAEIQSFMRQNGLTEAAPNLRTGEGMAEQSVLQSRRQMQQPVIDAANRHIANQTKLGERMNRASRSPTPVTNAAALYAPMAAANSIMGAKAGSAIGERINPEYGGVIGGAVGGAVGGISGEGGELRSRLARAAYDPENPGTLRYKSPTELAQRVVLGRDPNLELSPIKGPVTPVSQSPVPGGYKGPPKPSAAPDMEPAPGGGFQPKVQRVPVPSGQQAPVTVQQVPGPDTPGRGNLLTPAAKRGVEGAGAELVRRGRPVLYTPEEYPRNPMEGTLEERMGLGKGATTKPMPLSQPEQPGGETLEDWIRRRPTGGDPNRGTPPPQDPVDAGRAQYKRIIKPRKEGEQ